MFLYIIHLSGRRVGLISARRLARLEYTAKIGWTILWFGMPGILAGERMVVFNVIVLSIQFALVS